MIKDLNYSGQPPVNVLSVDVEEYYHASIFQRGTKHLGPLSFESRVEANMDNVLRLLEDHNVLSTFFILGEVAAAHPQMVKRICHIGHEVACHGYAHQLVSRQRPDEFREDVHRAKSVLEDLVGKPVFGYRAPSFSIGRDQEWAYGILSEEGFRYDSSVYPIVHDIYGHPGAPRFPHRIVANDRGNLVEFPIGTTRLFNVNLPMGGGGYFRLLPTFYFNWGIGRVNRVEQKPIMFYFHPWELDLSLPHVPMPWRHRFRLYVGVGNTKIKLSALLQKFRFDTTANVLGIP